jgi:hypothetical protein
VRLAQIGHLLTPFVDDAEGRSHEGSDANRPVIEINRKKRCLEPMVLFVSYPNDAHHWRRASDVRYVN